jgi:hypothetical protein
MAMLEEELPNIPGIRRNPVISKRVPQSLKMIHGTRLHDQRDAPPPSLPGKLTRSA